MNGHEFDWANLFARLDRSAMLQERMALDSLVHNQLMRESMERLPERIASAIVAHPTTAALTEPASRLSDLSIRSLIEVLETLSFLCLVASPLAGLGAVIAGRMGWDVTPFFRVLQLYAHS